MRTLPARGNVRGFADTSAATPLHCLKDQLELRSNTDKLLKVSASLIIV